jgi:hypothetical protein
MSKCSANAARFLSDSRCQNDDLGTRQILVIACANPWAARQRARLSDIQRLRNG